MINEIDILHERHSCDFTCHASENTARLFCVVSYHHKIVIELREYRFDSFTGPFIGPCRWTPVFRIQPIWDSGRQFTPGIELPSTDKIWEILLAFMLQTTKKEIPAIEAEGLSCYAKSNDFVIGKLGNNTTSGHFSILIDTTSGKFLTDVESPYGICCKVALMQCDST